MNSKYISSKILTQFIENDSLDRLSYYVAIKKAHKSGSLLKITQLAKQIGCSYNALKYHLDLFEKLNLLSVSDKKLYFVSTNKLIWKLKTKRIQPQNKVVKRKLYLKFENTQVKELKKEIKEFILLNSLFRQGQLQKKQHKALLLKHAGISAESLGKKINRSRITGQRLITRMKNNNIIKVTPKFEFVQEATLAEFRYLRNNFLIPQYCTFINNIIWRQTYSEMEVVKKTKVAKLKRINFFGITNVVKSEIESITVKIEENPIKQLYHGQPKGYFNKGYLRKQGLSEKQIKKIFIREAACIYSDLDKYPTFLMSFKTYTPNQGKKLC